MTVESDATDKANVETIFAEPHPTPISDELSKLRTAVLDKLPHNAAAKFEYDGRLSLHVDVRSYEDRLVVEALLPGLCGGIFSHLQRGTSGQGSHRHRVSAVVAR